MAQQHSRRDLLKMGIGGLAAGPAAMVAATDAAAEVHEAKHDVLTPANSFSMWHEAILFPTRCVGKHSTRLV